MVCADVAGVFRNSTTTRRSPCTSFIAARGAPACTHHRHVVDVEARVVSPRDTAATDARRPAHGRIHTWTGREGPRRAARYDCDDADYDGREMQTMTNAAPPLAPIHSPLHDPRTNPSENACHRPSGGAISITVEQQE
ncbi:hypothetical protein C8J57DRAFT_1722538 [Mycena rebaudengoi]|nr:hypothetical protein C8J57DRAFT_1722538 [Mycena rebaudengoi]